MAQGGLGELSSPKPPGLARPSHRPPGEVGRGPRLADRPSWRRWRGHSQLTADAHEVGGARFADQQSPGGEEGASGERASQGADRGRGGRRPRDPRRPRCPPRAPGRSPILIFTLWKTRSPSSSTAMLVGFARGVPPNSRAERPHSPGSAPYPAPAGSGAPRPPGPTHAPAHRSYPAPHWPRAGRGART